MASEKLFELRRRTFDTPHFRGIEFIEVEAKSIVNHVPGSYLPFKWTINPYRGCSHACSYCMAGDTPILMADGRTKPLADVEVGDSVYGTERVGSYRRYLPTRVLDHWSTIKEAFEIGLEDGTQLVASGDHRFLTDRGWKYVTGTECGKTRRPHLTPNNRLIGTGRFARQPSGGSDYRLGYVCGLIRGDGHVGSYGYPRPNGTLARVHRFRLALVDLQALRRARDYLTAIGIDTKEFAFQEAVGDRKPLSAIRTSRHGDIIQNAIRWPRSGSDEWAKGFLAGIFDAEGSHSGSLRIANSDSEIIGQITSCLHRFGFRYRQEVCDRQRPMTYVRLLGGLKEHLRFFHLTDPAISRKRSIEMRAVKNRQVLRVISVRSLGVAIPMYDITTGTGDFIANGVISHNCFARVTHTYMDMNAGRDFESKIVVKVNAPELLRKKLRSKGWKGEHIAMGTATDPYQRAEGRYKIMPRIIEALADYRNPFSILTKGTLILRDLELLSASAEATQVSTALSIGTLDEDAWRKSEPGTPHPRKRMEAVARLNHAGVPCGVMVAPVLPGITDDRDMLREVVDAAVEAGASHVTPILLHLRPIVREEYMGWLREHYPNLVESYEAMYRRAYAPKSDQNALAAAIGALVAEAAPREPARPRKGNFRKERVERMTAQLEDVEQLRLI
jgi:DNA repair photolyase